MRKVKYYPEYEEWLKEKGYARTSKNYSNWRRRNTPEGFLIDKYYAICQKVQGKRGFERMRLRWKGLPALTKEEWQLFCEYTYTQFLRMWDIFILNNKEHKLCPTIDRIDATKGYTLDNIRWLTAKENSDLGNISRWKTVKEKQNETKI